MLDTICSDWMEPIPIKNETSNGLEKLVEKIRIRLLYELLGLDSVAGIESSHTRLL